MCVYTTTLRLAYHINRIQARLCDLVVDYLLSHITASIFLVYILSILIQVDRDSEQYDSTKFTGNWALSSLLIISARALFRGPGH
jgi:hypothetical protein